MNIKAWHIYLIGFAYVGIFSFLLFNTSSVTANFLGNYALYGGIGLAGYYLLFKRFINKKQEQTTQPKP